tara:strand:+ start:176 stop:442 length:267 start_codon:yes stop_codon:yes gene_type:complete
MKKFIYLILFSLLTSCTSGAFTNRSGDNSNLSFDSGFCRSLSRSKHPGYICKNPLMCTMEEVNIVLNDLTQRHALYKNCMFSKNYDYK